MSNFPKENKTTPQREGSRRDDNYDINDRIKQLREKRGWTRKELADKIYVSLDTIKKIENLDRRVTIDKLYLFQKLFNVPFDYLLTGNEAKGSFERLWGEISTLPTAEKKEVLERLLKILL